VSTQAHGRSAPVAGTGLRRQLPALERLDSPVTSYYVLLGATLLLLVIGLVMVLSASSVTSLTKSGSSFTVFRSQLFFAAVGVPLMLLASRVPVRAWKAIGWVALVVALLAQALVFSPLGVSVNGNRNWIGVGSMRLQPSEGMKLALVLWGAAVLARKRSLLDRWVHVLVPVMFPVGVLAIGLVLAGHDLGTALVLLLIMAALLFAAGAPGRVFLTAGGAMTGLVAVMVVTSENRMRRVASWLGGQCQDQLGTCYQSIHGKYALADGGWWGVGLGASREKWSWLPEAHNDFIFAIIGEELGLPGALVVLALFLLIGWACLRLVTRSEDLFVRIASAAAMAWLLGQTLINVGAVIGMLPVVGVPLPLVSSGGSALVTSLVLLGMLMSFARAEPGAAEALTARTGLLRRSLAVLPGRRLRAQGARGGRS
jgi:cell division protein FtsW